MKLREKLKWGQIYASIPWATPTPRLMFITIPEAPSCAAPPAGHPAVNVGYTLGPGPASDSPESLRTAHINLTGQIPGKESNPKCPEALPAKSVLDLITMCTQLTYRLSFCLSLDSLNPFPQRPSYWYFSFPLWAVQKNEKHVSALSLLLPRLAHKQALVSSLHLQALMKMGSCVQQQQLWLPTWGLQ